jgi:bifunctional non-homologous end joining protein LigD
VNGEDLRQLPLIERKRRLRQLIGRRKLGVLYVDHVERTGAALLFEHVCRLDLEGIVAKRKSSPYHVTVKRSPYWIKIRNQDYSQKEGREELFQR